MQLLAAMPIAASAKSNYSSELGGRIFKAVKVSMIQHGDTTLEKFQIARDAGFDGISLFAPDRFEVTEALQAQDKTGVRIHNINGTHHWKQRLSDPDLAIREQALQNLKDLIESQEELRDETENEQKDKLIDSLKSLGIE